jgi:chorismate-pyruvate lyase
MQHEIQDSIIWLDKPVANLFYLCYQESLTALFLSNKHNFKLHILYDGIVVYEADNINLYEKHYRRETLIFINDKPFIYAITQCSLEDAIFFGIDRLGSKSLGNILFDDNSNIIKGEFKFCYTDAFNNLERLNYFSTQAGKEIKDKLHGRKRIFTKQSHSLVLYEIFLTNNVV